MKLYAILGSHACASAALMLEHKGLDYERVDLPIGLHPVAVRVLGFRGEPPADRPYRMADFAGRLGTVPALHADGAKVQTTRAIARFLEDLRPDPPLFPPDAEERRRVEEAERWGDEVLQMAARRAVLPPAARGEIPAGGRLGPLLYRNETIRRVSTRFIGGLFHASPGSETLPDARAALDRADELLAAGVIGGERLNAADFMIAPSVALMEYHPELREDIAGRPLTELLDRMF